MIYANVPNCKWCRHKIEFNISIENEVVNVRQHQHHHQSHIIMSKVDWDSDWGIRKRNTPRNRLNGIDFTRLWPKPHKTKLKWHFVAEVFVFSFCFRSSFLRAFSLVCCYCFLDHERYRRHYKINVKWMYRYAIIYIIYIFFKLYTFMVAKFKITA